MAKMSEREMILLIKDNCDNLSESHMNEILSNRKLSLYLLREKTDCFKLIKNEYKTDIFFIKEAILANAFVFKELPVDLRDNKLLALYAIERSGYIIEYCSKRLQMERDVALAAIRQEPFALEFINYFQYDKDLILEAIKNRGGSIAYATNFQDDEEVALIACSNEAESYFSISDRLRSDIKFNIDCVLNNQLILEFIDNIEILENKDFLYGIKEVFETSHKKEKNKDYYSKLYENLKKFQREDEMLSSLKNKDSFIRKKL